MAGLPWYNERSREQLKREISLTIQNEVRDPRIPALTSVTDLKLAADTRNATVYVSVYGTDDEKNAAVEALNHAAPFVQKVVAKRVSFRHFPKFYFKLDTSMEYGDHIEQLLKTVRADLG